MNQSHEFAYDEGPRDCECLLRFELTALNNVLMLVCFLVEFWTVLRVYLCSRPRSPMLSDVNRGNSCM